MIENTKNTNENPVENSPVAKTDSPAQSPAQSEWVLGSLDDLGNGTKDASAALFDGGEKQPEPVKPKTTEAEEQPIASNPQAKGEETQPEADLDLSGLTAAVDWFSSAKDSKKKIDFNVKPQTSAKDKAMQEAVFERTFFNKMTRVVMFTLVSLILAFAGYVFQQYVHFIEGKPVANVVDYYMPTIHKTYLKVANLFGQNPDVYGIDSLTTANAEITLNSIVSDKSLTYIAKKEVLNRSVEQLVRSTATQYQKLDEIKQDIGGYGFFPKDVQLFAESTFMDNSLQKSLIAVEAIRFSTALTFFSNLDTFVQQFSSFVSLSQSQVENMLTAYRTRGEKDIQNYLTTCYFNPYVSADTCSMPQGNDFANYYTYVDTNAPVDTKVFPILMNYLDAQLEDTDFPSLSINIRNFDPLQNNISFGIELNTFQEDELQLLNKGILNPHIYLATKIINLLRESKFVVAGPISLQTLRVNKKKLRIGSQEYVVNNSAFDFTLPLQKNAEREIYDFDQKQQ